MNLSKDKVIGIVGGMGPAAGVALMNSILDHTIAVTDQEHLSTILMSFPKHITDRTAFLEGAAGRNPAFSIAEVIRRLETAGAGIVGMACNTSYSPDIYNVILEELDRTGCQVKMLHMPMETCRFIRHNYPAVRNVGVMTTNGAYKAQVYKQCLEREGYHAIVPPAGFQNDIIHNMIYDPVFGLKATNGRVTSIVWQLLDEAMRFFRQMRAELIVLGCTELFSLHRGYKINEMPVVDSTAAFAAALIREALKEDPKETLKII